MCSRRRVLAPGFGRGAKAAAEEAAEGGIAFETRHAADGGNGFVCFYQQSSGGGEADVDQVLMGCRAEAVAEHTKEVLTVQPRFFSHFG